MPWAHPSLRPSVALECRYYWVWIGLGAVLASIVINVAVFVLAATFLKGELRGPALHGGWCSCGAAVEEQGGRVCQLMAWQTLLWVEPLLTPHPHPRWR